MAMTDRLREKAKKAARLAAWLTVPATLVIFGVAAVVGPVDFSPYVLAFLAGALVSGNPHAPNDLVLFAVIIIENFVFLFAAIFFSLFVKDWTSSPENKIE